MLFTAEVFEGTPTDTGVEAALATIVPVDAPPSNVNASYCG